MSKFCKKQPASPFNFNRLYGNEKFNLNNMELTSVNMPDLVEKDHACSVWHDTIRDQWWEAAKQITSAYSSDAFFAGASDESLLAFAQIIATLIGFKFPVTGARIVRFTGADEYPRYRLDMVNGGKRDPNRRLRSYRFGSGLEYDYEEAEAIREVRGYAEDDGCYE